MAVGSSQCTGLWYSDVFEEIRKLDRLVIAWKLLYQHIHFQCIYTVLSLGTDGFTLDQTVVFSYAALQSRT